MNTAQYHGTVRKYMEIRHVKSLEALRQHTTIGSGHTFAKYWKCPELLPIGVFEDIMKALKVPEDEQLNIWRER